MIVNHYHDNSDDNGVMHHQWQHDCHELDNGDVHEDHNKGQHDSYEDNYNCDSVTMCEDDANLCSITPIRTMQLQLNSDTVEFSDGVGLGFSNLEWSTAPLLVCLVCPRFTESKNRRKWIKIGQGNQSLF
jgi:hypothetical protein